MKVHQKLALVLLAAVLLIFTLSRTWDVLDQRQTLSTLAANNLRELEANEWKNAENVYFSVHQAVAGSLERGEMEKFQRLLESQSAIQGLLDFSLYDYRGLATHSTKPDLVGTELPNALAKQLVNEPDKLARRTDDAFEIYQPLVSSPECVRCHTTWSDNMIAGVIGFRFSNAGIAQAEVAWASTQEASLSRALILFPVTVLVFGLVSFLSIRFGFKWTMGRTLGRATQDLMSNADQITSVAGQMSGGSTRLAHGTNTQASSLEETSASLEEMTAMTRRNNENAEETKKLARAAVESVENSAGVVANMQQTMSSIDAAARETAGVAKTIDEIAFQTNILALNAAVEAARAGEAGAGFAVVAEEVRTLAKRSAEAARIATDRVTGVTQESATGVTMSNKLGQALDDILARVRQVNKLAEEVATASDEQNRGFQQVSGAIQQIDRVTQENSASAEESASAAEELEQQAKALRDTVRELVRLVGIGTTGEAQEAAFDRTSGPPAGTRTGARRPRHLTASVR